jgi:chorismate mutase
MSDARSTLEELRSRIEVIDRQLVELIGRRREVALQIGRTKQSLGLPVLDPQQEAKVVRRAAEIARELGVDEELTRDVIWRIIAAARDAQEGRTRWGPPPSEPTGGRDARGT